MIIWSGWGILVPVIVAVAFVICALALGGLLPEAYGAAVGVAVAGVVSGVALWFVARALDGREGRFMIDEKTGQRVELRKTAGSFFFIPTRFWAFIMPVAGLLLAGATLLPGAN